MYSPFVGRDNLDDSRLHAVFVHLFDKLLETLELCHCRLEDRDVASIPVMVGLNRFAVIFVVAQIQIAQFRIGVFRLVVHFLRGRWCEGVRGLCACAGDGLSGWFGVVVGRRRQRRRSVRGRHFGVALSTHGGCAGRGVV